MKENGNIIQARKAVMIGCGFVGSASAFALMNSGVFSELVLVDVDKKKAEGEAMDIGHGQPFASPMKIYAGTYDDIRDAMVVIITAGANQKPGESRLDLVHKNVAIFRTIIPEITAREFEGILLVVSNPVDILTYTALKLSGYPANRVIGSGTVLDTARLKYEVGMHLGVDSRSVHAFIVGEHGDSELAVFSSATVAGLPLDDFCELRGHFNHREAAERIFENVKNSAYEIIERKGATYYGIAMAVRRICEAIVRNEKSIMPVSCYMNGENGISGLVLSMPAILGAGGVEKRIPISMNREERDKLEKSADLLREIIREI